jgi:signal peptidase I
MSSALEPTSVQVHTPTPQASVTDRTFAAVYRPRRARSRAREYGEALVLAFVMALVIRTFVVQAFQIPSASMYPTLHVGDHILVNKFVYGLSVPLVGTRLMPFSAPQRGDVVVFVYPVDPSKDFVKRVVAVAGDVVEIRDTRVVVNGQVWDDPHGYFDDEMGRHASGLRGHYGPATVPDGKVFLLGDNRDHSYDSRFWGFVDVRNIKGKAFFIYWSWDGSDQWVRWDRIGAVVH